MIADARATYAAGVVPVNSRNSRMKCGWSAYPLPAAISGQPAGRSVRLGDFRVAGVAAGQHGA